MHLLNSLLAFEKVWSPDKDRKRHLLHSINSVLMVLILAIILIVLAKELFFNLLIDNDNLFLLFLVFLLLNITSFLIQKGFIRLAAFSIVTCLLFASFKTTLSLGVDFHILNIIYSFIILMSAVLITPKFSLFICLLISLVISVIFFLQFNGHIVSDYSWKSFPPNFPNVLIILIIYASIAFLSWFSFKEFELEIKKLKKLHLKKLIMIAPILDLGKMSTGMIYDIREQLSIISIILQNAQANKNFVNNIELAFDAVDKIDNLSRLNFCKLFDQSELEIFDLNLEIKKITGSFKYKSKKNKVKIIFEPNKSYQLHADRMKLDQVLARLILNAIESYENIKGKDKNIFIKLIKNPRNLLIKVKDYGTGINKVNLPFIFNPYFSLKDNDRSLGLSLYMSQKAMIKTYETKIRAESVFGVGSTFTLYIKNKFLLI